MQSWQGVPGPLGGIYTALEHTRCEALLILASDMPFVNRSFIQGQCDAYLQEPCDILVPRYLPEKNNMEDQNLLLKIEPLHSIYRKGLEERLKSYIKSDNMKSIHGFIQSEDAHFLEIHDDPIFRHMFTNLNTKEDFYNSGADF